MGESTMNVQPVNLNMQLNEQAEPPKSLSASATRGLIGNSTSIFASELGERAVEYVCPKTGQIMFAPVITSYGVTFEQEACDGGISNWNLKIAILQFLKSNPQYWPAVYIPKALKDPLANAKTEKSLAPLVPFLQEELEQIRAQLAKLADAKVLEQNQLEKIQLLLSLYPLNYLLHKLGKEFIQQALPLAEQRYLLQLAGQNLDIKGAVLVAKHLRWQHGEYYAALCHFIQSQDKALVDISLNLMKAQGLIGILNTPPAGQPYPLHVAVPSLNLDLIKLLLEAKADIQATDDQGNTVLHVCAVQADSPTLREIIKYLVKQEADLTKINSAGQTVYQIASSKALAGYIEKLHLKPNHPDVFHYQKQKRVELEQKNQALQEENEVLIQENEVLQAEIQAKEEQLKLLQQALQAQTAAKLTAQSLQSSEGSETFTISNDLIYSESSSPSTSLSSLEDVVISLGTGDFVRPSSPQLTEAAATPVSSPLIKNRFFSQPNQALPPELEAAASPLAQDWDVVISEDYNL